MLEGTQISLGDINSEKATAEKAAAEKAAAIPWSLSDAERALIKTLGGKS